MASVFARQVGKDLLDHGGMVDAGSMQAMIRIDPPQAEQSPPRT
jgi:hypothetical protein